MNELNSQQNGWDSKPIQILNSQKKNGWDSKPVQICEGMVGS